VKIAGRHRYRAAKAEKVSTQRWHETRAAGAMKRFDTVRDCCNRALWRELPCDHQEDKHRKVKLGCADWRACVHCRGKRARRYRARFRAARGRALEKYRFARQGGRWSEKFFTATVPHVGTIEDRMSALKSAWPKFQRMLKSHLACDIGIPRNMLGYDWINVMETTLGDDEHGHPHLHVWLILPFVHHAMLRLFWARALPERFQAALPMKPVEEVIEEARGGDRGRRQLRAWLVTRRGPNGRPLERMPWPVFDARAAKDVEHELIKYLVKDSERVEGTMTLMDPEAFGRIYAAYHGRRSISASRGFWLPPREPMHCEECGVLWRTVGVYDEREVADTIGGLFYALGALVRAREKNEPPPRIRALKAV
jgi:hypothetical protein